MPNFCLNLLKYNEVVVLNEEIGILMVCLGVIYLLMSLAIIYFIKIQEYYARFGNDEAVKSVIFPIFVYVLWANACVNIFIGFVALSFTFAPYDHDAGSVWSFSVMYAAQHIVTEGVALLLMQKGLGLNAAKQALKWALFWGAITLISQSIVYTQDPTTSYITSITWQSLLLVFYLVLWISPQKHLYRRPACIFYAQLWVFYRVVSMVSTTLFYISYTRAVGNCLFVFACLFPFAIFEPIILYYTLLQDSKWWQGMEIIQGWRSERAEEIRSPLQGIDITLKSAQSLAKSIDVMGKVNSKLESFHVVASYLSPIRTKKANYTGNDESRINDYENNDSYSNNPTNSNFSKNIRKDTTGGTVKLLNFAYISLDKKVQLGSGSFSRVYQGKYRQQHCAIKLIFTVDLTIEVIKRIAMEAQLLSMIRHPNVVDILGVAVLPPSICILLELCSRGSLGDVLKGNTLVNANSYQFSLFTESGLDNSINITSDLITGYVNGFLNFDEKRFSNRVNSDAFTQSDVSNRHAAILGTIQQTSDSPILNYSGDIKPASGMKGLSLCWRDRLYVALGCARGLHALHSFSSDLCHRDIKSFNFLIDNQLNAKISDLELGMSNLFQNNKISEECAEKTPMKSDEILANWAAPEVINGDVYTQASDIYSFGLVLCEILTGRIPFSDIKAQDKIRQSVISGMRPLIPRCFSLIEHELVFKKYLDLIQKMWSANKSERPTSYEVLHALETMWLNTTENDFILSLDENCFNEYENTSLITVSSLGSHNLSFSHNISDLMSSKLLVNGEIYANKVLEHLQIDENIEYLNALENTCQAWVIVTPDSPHYIVWATYAWCKIFGYTLDCITGKPIHTLDMFDSSIYTNDPLIQNLTKEHISAKRDLSHSFKEQSCGNSFFLFCGLCGINRSKTPISEKHENAVNTALFFKSLCSKRIIRSKGCHAIINLSDYTCKSWNSYKSSRKSSKVKSPTNNEFIASIYSVHGFPIKRHSSEQTLDSLGNIEKYSSPKVLPPSKKREGFGGIEDGMHSNIDSFPESNLTHGNSFSDPKHKLGNSFSDPKHKLGNSFSEPKHKLGNSFSDPKHKLGNSFSDPKHKLGNSFSEPKHKLGNSFSEPKLKHGNSFSEPHTQNSIGTSYKQIALVKILFSRLQHSSEILNQSNIQSGPENSTPWNSFHSVLNIKEALNSISIGSFKEKKTQNNSVEINAMRDLAPDENI